MIKVSIIVPVYNCEAYLRRCVESLTAQTEKKLQIILVDDGSRDGSGALCDELARQDSRIVVLHQENAGVSAARNTGLGAVTGEYVGFVDADDHIDPQTYEIALKAIQNCDIAMWDTRSVYDDGSTGPDTISGLEGDRVLHRRDWNPELLSQMAGSVCRCLYRAELLSGLRFPVGIKLSEDRLFNLQAMGKAERLHYMKTPLYARYVRKGSACNSYHGDLFEKSIRAKELADEILDRYWSRDYRNAYTRLLIINSVRVGIYQVCSQASPHKSLKERYSAIRTMLTEPKLAEAFACCPPQGLVEKLMAKRLTLAMLAVAWVFQMKNGR